MPTSEEFYLFIKGKLSFSDNVSYRKMMGEYLIYKDGKVVGGLYDDRFLMKPTNKSSGSFRRPCTNCLTRGQNR
ncbi:MAG: hypothetical protein IJ800_03045 [Clostridia bacterium]|nr:hypothetical protein [Clostridia bacterium]